MQAFRGRAVGEDHVVIVKQYMEVLDRGDRTVAKDGFVVQQAFGRGQYLWFTKQKLRPPIFQINSVVLGDVKITVGPSFA